MPNFPLVGQVLDESLPLYPPLLQLLRVTAATVAGPSGVAQTAGSSVLGPTLYVSYTQQLRTDGLLPRDREPCLVDDINGAGLQPGYYLGRLAGSHTSLPVYEVGAAGSTITGRGDFAKCLVATPNADALYNARLQTHNANGTLSDNGDQVWIREANLLTTLSVDYIYNVKHTGRAGSPTRDVYTVEDFNLTVTNEGLTQLSVVALYLMFAPNPRWTISTHSDRIAKVVYNGIDIKDLHTGTTYTDVWKIEYDSTPTVYDNTKGDYVFTFTTSASERTLKIRLNGFTGNQDWLTRCVSGDLKKKNMTCSNGLVKVLSAESSSGP